MKTNIIQLEAGSVVELSLATVKSGFEKQLFGHYFPEVTPIVLGLGGKPLGSFSISHSDSILGNPKMGALFQWPSVGVFNQLHDNTDFLKLKPVRDEALEFFSNGHFFLVNEDTQLTIEEAQTYAISTHQSRKVHSADMLNLIAEETSMNSDYTANNLAIALWSKHHYSKSINTEVFKCQFNFAE